MKICSLLVIIFSVFSLFAQNNLGPRLTAMAENGAAVPDIWCLQANPAGVTVVNRPSIAITYAKHLFSNEVSTQGLVAVIPIRNNFFGASFQRYGFAEFNETKVGFAYVKRFGDNFSLSINTNYHQLKILNYGVANGFSVDIGSFYTINKEIAFGAFVNNPFNQKYTSSETFAKIHSAFNIGASYLPSDKVLIATTLTKSIEESIDVKFGIEYKIISSFSLRGGLSANPFKQYAGFGLNIKSFLLDFATVFEANLGYAPQIGVSYVF